MPARHGRDPRKTTRAVSFLLAIHQLLSALSCQVEFGIPAVQYDELDLKISSRIGLAFVAAQNEPAAPRLRQSQICAPIDVEKISLVRLQHRDRIADLQPLLVWRNSAVNPARTAQRLFGVLSSNNLRARKACRAAAASVPSSLACHC